MIFKTIFILFPPKGAIYLASFNIKCRFLGFWSAVCIYLLQ